MLYGFYRLLFYGLLIYLIYKILRFFQSPGKNRRNVSAPKKKSGLMVKDKMCNTYLPKENAIREVHKGKEYFFCSDECRRKFLQSKKDKQPE